MTDRARWQTAFAIVDEVESLDPEVRTRRVAERCGGDEALASKVHRLLHHMTRDAPSPLDDTALGLVQEELSDDPVLQQTTSAARGAAQGVEVGTTLGRYRLVELLGEGGMSVVYEAERADDPGAAAVAVKILTARGSDRDVLAERFHAERQILATLDHPNVARVYDGGTTPAGQPYLVMERVHGTPVTTYLRAKRQDIAARLACFLAICDAIGHAHQRLVVHRDIKPANVLVTDDGTVKLLDFGISKLLDPAQLHLDDDSPATRAGLWLMTPTYAAPEQVTGAAISTATDVFGLGALLFELLTDMRPRNFVTQELRDVVEAVAGTAIPRPSAAVHAAGHVRARRLEGDLDAIVARATAPDPADRYASVRELRDDVSRHLRGEAVRARGASPVYRARRWLRRHRVPVLSASTLVLALVGALVLHTRQVGAERDRAAAAARRAEESATFLREIFTLSDPDEQVGRTITATDLLDRAAGRIERELTDDPSLQVAMLSQMVRIYRKLGQDARAEPLAERALAIGTSAHVPHGDLVGAAVALASLHLTQSRYVEADSLLEAAFTWTGTDRGGASVARAAVLEAKAAAVFEQSHLDAADSLYRAALEIREQVAPDDVAIAGAHDGLGHVLSTRGMAEEAEPHFREALRIRSASLERPNTEISGALERLAACLNRQGRHQDAEPLVREALDEYGALLGPDHANVARAYGTLGFVLGEQRRYAEAIDAFEEGLRIRRLRQGEHHINVHGARNNIANMQRRMGDHEAAEATYRQVLATCRAVLGDDHAITAIYRGNLADVLVDLGRPAEAVSELRAAIDVLAETFGATSPRVASRQRILGNALHALGAHEAADSAYAAAHATYVVGTGESYRGRHRLALERGRLLVDTHRYAEATDVLAPVHAHYLETGDDLQRTRARLWLAAAQAEIAETDDARARATEQVRAALEALRARLPASRRAVREAESLAGRS